MVRANCLGTKHSLSQGKQRLPLSTGYRTSAEYVGKLSPPLYDVNLLAREVFSKFPITWLLVVVYNSATFAHSLSEVCSIHRINVLRYTHLSNA